MNRVKSFDELKNPPIFLHHGTECENIPSICKSGILPSSEEMANPYTKKGAFDISHVEDTEGNVSMAVDLKDSIFFIVANRKTKEEWMKPQCILRVATYKLDRDKLFFRDLFKTEYGEGKYMDVVPPEALEGYLERAFSTDKKGKLKVVETWKLCPIK